MKDIINPFYSNQLLHSIPSSGVVEKISTCGVRILKVQLVSLYKVHYKPPPVCIYLHCVTHCRLCLVYTSLCIWPSQLQQCTCRVLPKGVPHRLQTCVDQQKSIGCGLLTADRGQQIQSIDWVNRLTCNSAIHPSHALAFNQQSLSVSWSASVRASSDRSRRKSSLCPVAAAPTVQR